MIYGTPAGSLATGTFGTAATRAAGAAGEHLTAAVLNGFWEKAAIFHDLTVPGFQINIDHAVLSGNRLMLIDSKTWKGGRYWSIGESYFRGLHAAHKPSKGVLMARESITDHLRPHGVKVVTPLVVLWSGFQATGRHLYGNRAGDVTGAWTNKEARPFLHYRYPGAKVIPGNDLHRRVHFLTHGRERPNQGALTALHRLLH